MRLVVVILNDEKSPTDAILNPLKKLVDEKESEILDAKNKFLDDDAIADNVVISEIFADDLNSQKFQLLYIKNEVYYLIHHAESGATAIVNKYNVDAIPVDLKPDTTLFKLISSDVDNKINPFLIKSSTDKVSIVRCSNAFSISFLEYPRTINPEIASCTFSLTFADLAFDSSICSSFCSVFNLSFNSKIIL